MAVGTRNKLVMDMLHEHKLFPVYLNVCVCVCVA